MVEDSFKSGGYKSQYLVVIVKTSDIRYGEIEIGL